MWFERHILTGKRHAKNKQVKEKNFTSKLKKQCFLEVSTMQIYFVFNKQFDITKLFYSLFNIPTTLQAIVVRSVCVCVRAYIYIYCLALC